MPRWSGDSQYTKRCGSFGVMTWHRDRVVMLIWHSLHWLLVWQELFSKPQFLCGYASMALLLQGTRHSGTLSGVAVGVSVILAPLTCRVYLLMSYILVMIAIKYSILNKYSHDCHKQALARVAGQHAVMPRGVILEYVLTLPERSNGNVMRNMGADFFIFYLDASRFPACSSLALSPPLSMPLRCSEAAHSNPCSAVRSPRGASCTKITIGR